MKYITNIDTLSSLLDRLISENIIRIKNLLLDVYKNKEYNYISEKRTYKADMTLNSLEQLIKSDIYTGEGDRDNLAELKKDNPNINLMKKNHKVLRSANELTLKINSEFAHELILAIPYAYWLHQNNQLEKIITSRGMKPFYYFCKNVEEKFETRTLDNAAAGLNDLPNIWPHHNALAVYGKEYNTLSLKEQIKTYR